MCAPSRSSGISAPAVIAIGVVAAAPMIVAVARLAASIISTIMFCAVGCVVIAALGYIIKEIALEMICSREARLSVIQLAQRRRALPSATPLAIAPVRMYATPVEQIQHKVTT